MQHNFVLNTESFPALDNTSGFELFLDTVSGMIASTSDGDRYSIYSDDLDNFEITPTFSYSDFLIKLGEVGKQDLQLALMESEDKSPMLDAVNPDELLEIASATYYFADEPYSGSSEVLAFAWYLEGSLLSIATHQKWTMEEISFYKYIEGQHQYACSYIKNISTYAHGANIKSLFEKSLEINIAQEFPLCKFSNVFGEWFRDLTIDLKKRVIAKLQMAYSKEFQGGQPLFDTLNDAEQLREIRFSAVQGGAIRILFDYLPDKKYAILVGFIKKASNEGYDIAIKTALEELKVIKQALQ